MIPALPVRLLLLFAYPVAEPIDLLHGRQGLVVQGLDASAVMFGKPAGLLKHDDETFAHRAERTIRLAARDAVTILVYN